MSDYTDAEASSLAQDLRQSFQNLYASARQRYDIAQGRHGFVKTANGGISIEANLIDMGYDIVRPVASREVEFARRTVVSTLDAPEYQIHIDPRRDSDQSRADKQEIVDSNLLLHIEQGGMMSTAVHSHQAISPYAALLVQQTPYDLPKRGESEPEDDYLNRVDQWKKNYCAMKVTWEDPLAWGFYEDGALNLTICAGEYEIPIAEFTRRYGDPKKLDTGNPDAVFSLFGEQFPGVKQNYGISDQRNEFLSGSKKIKVCYVDDGSRIAHYVQMNGAYVALSSMSDNAAYDNPWKIPSLVIIPGVFDPTGASPEDRYMPFLLPLMQSRWNKDMTWSQWASKAAKLPRFAAPLPPEVQNALLNQDPQTRAEYLASMSELRNGEINPTFGKPENLDAQMQAYEETLYREQANEHTQYVPHGAFSGSESSQTLIKGSPATSLLHLGELESQTYEPVWRLQFNGYIKLLEMHDNFWIGKEADKAGTYDYSIRTSGKERVQGKVIQRGQVVDMTPGQGGSFDFPKDRSINRIDKRASTQQANLAAIYMRMQAPNGNDYVTDEEVIGALGIENATEYQKQIRAETRYKRIQQANDALTLAAAVKRNALTLGVDVSSYLLNQSGVPPQNPQQQAPGQNVQTSGQGGIVRMAPPAGNTNPVGVSG